MAENLPRSIEVPVGLTTFGGLVTELNPSDLPEGVSPDNQDVVYLPGSVDSRPGLRRQYPQLGTSTITFLKSYVTPNRAVLNLILDSTGQLWKEDVFNAPRVLVPLTRITPGSYCSSTTAFGKEYLAFHDGKNPTDIPLQFDGQFVDRVTQDGPATAPVVTSQPLEPVQLTSQVPGGNTGITAMAVSDPQVITSASGTDNLDYAIPPPYQHNYLPPTGDPTIVHVSITVYQYLAVTTATGHGLSVGDVINIGGMTPLDYNGIWTVAIVVDATHVKLFYGRSFNPGPVTVLGTINKAGTSLARINNAVTVHCATPHGLNIGMRFTLSGVPNTTYDVLVSTSRDANGLVTAVQTNGKKMVPGSQMNITGVADATFNGLCTVLSADPTLKTFTYEQAGLGVAVSAGGAVEDIWQGQFVIAQVINNTDFIYNQLGPDDITSSLGTVTPTPFMEGGARSVVVMFVTRQGYVTRPSPPAKIQTATGQPIIVQLPIGPPNVVARAVGITGVDGGQFFIIPTQPSIGGTPTLVPDNTSSKTLIDFADNTLFASTAIDVKGNNVFSQRVIRGGIGFANYSSRLICWGDRNRIPNLLNMGFDGGYLVDDPTSPPGWTVSEAGGTLVMNDPRGFAWQITGDGTNVRGEIEQSAYKDVYGVPIFSSNTKYTLRLWAKRVVGNSGSIVGVLFSPSQGVLSVARIFINTVPDGGGFMSADFDTVTPATIPLDTFFQIHTDNQILGDVIMFDETEVVFTANPVTLGVYGSYVNNPEAFNGVTGQVAPAEDNSPVQCAFVFRDLLHLLTLHGFHSTRDSQISEPSGWSVTEITLVCGAASPRAADVAENFVVWISSPLAVPPSGRGLYIYEGGNVLKISQEIQDIFDSSNPLAEHSIWLKNDPVTRRIYCGLPIGSATAPSQVIPLDYRELNTAADIADRAPIRISFTGKMICSDLSRKWTKWNVAANCAELMVMPDHSVQLSFGGGNGEAPGVSAGFGNSYYLDKAKKTDDDYGVIVPYYFTYFFVPHEQEQAIGVGAHRKLFKRYSIYITGAGQLSIIPYANSMQNPQPEALNLPLGNGQFDLGGGLNTQAERCSFRISSKPLQGHTDNSFSLAKFIPTMMQEPVSPIRFGAV